MKVNDITVDKDGESINVMSTFSADELQKLLQFAVNMSATIGLTTARNYERSHTEDDEEYELND